MSILEKLARWFVDKPTGSQDEKTEEPAVEESRSFNWRERDLDMDGMPRPDIHALLNVEQPTGAPAMTMDSTYIGEPNDIKRNWTAGLPEAQIGWFASNRFIGYQLCALIATNWLVDKACLMPAKDAAKNGYYLGAKDEETSKLIRKTDKKYRLTKNLVEFIHFGRVFGGRILIYNVESTDPEYFMKPFNIDGVQPGSYKGVIQVDPNWAQPVLTSANIRDPGAPRYYEPNFWRIGNRLYHYSHLHIYIPHPVPDYLKPEYNYLGVSTSQRIAERVYAAERCADEGPQLLLTKRSTIVNVSDEALSKPQRLWRAIKEWVSLRDNFGVKVQGAGESLQQFDTSLTDVDSVTMTQYQLVSAGSGVPVTKLLETQPKGWNSSGDYEAESYREGLESIQDNDLTPVLERHYQLDAKSRNIDAGEISIQWQPTDAPTAKEYAETELIKAQRDVQLIQAGAIDGEDVRNRLRADRDGDYHNIEEVDFSDNEEETPPVEVAA